MLTDILLAYTTYHLYTSGLIYWQTCLMLHIYILGKQKISCQFVFWANESGAGPGFDIRGEEIRQGVWGQLKVPGGSRAEPWLS